MSEERMIVVRPPSNATKVAVFYYQGEEWASSNDEREINRPVETLSLAPRRFDLTTKAYRHALQMIEALMKIDPAHPALDYFLGMRDFYQYEFPQLEAEAKKDGLLEGKVFTAPKGEYVRVASKEWVPFCVMDTKKGQCDGAGATECDKCPWLNSNRVKEDGV